MDLKFNEALRASLNLSRTGSKVLSTSGSLESRQMKHSNIGTTSDKAVSELVESDCFIYL